MASQMLSWSAIMFAWNARPPHPKYFAGSDWKKTWKELRSLCSKSGLDTTGGKDDFIQRLSKLSKQSKRNLNSRKSSPGGEDFSKGGGNMEQPPRGQRSAAREGTAPERKDAGPPKLKWVRCDGEVHIEGMMAGKSYRGMCKLDIETQRYMVYYPDFDAGENDVAPDRLSDRAKALS